MEHAAELAEAGIQVAILEVDDNRDSRVVDELQRYFRHVIILRAFDDLPLEGVEIRNFGGFMGVEYTNNLLKRRNRIVKRVMDIVVGGLALTLALPVIVVAGLVVKVVSPGAAFYKQRRIGLNGKVFPVVKIRTMRPNADRIAEQKLEPEQLEEWKRNKKLVSDPRLIPGVGRFLRRWSIDELPQLLSVVSGRMTLVGPRPLPDYHLDEFPTSFRTLRERVRPGVTGMWQVMIRSDGGLKEQEAFDSYYIRNWSIWLDIYLLAKTITAVLSGRGAY
jgi:lipopolysaccharide/colanic/teichoic acid biosynthesis glycosyltransferase